MRRETQLRPQDRHKNSGYKNLMGVILLIIILIFLVGCQLIPEYRCGANFYDCEDFNTQKEAQKALEYCGGPEKDVHNLDLDDDGLACEDN